MVGRFNGFDECRGLEVTDRSVPELVVRAAFKTISPKPMPDGLDARSLSDGCGNQLVTRPPIESDGGRLNLSRTQFEFRDGSPPTFLFGE